MQEENNQIVTQENSMLAIVARVASDPTVDVAKLEKLLDMQERVMNKQAEIAYCEAMAKLQPELPQIKKTKRGHNCNYAPLDEIDKIIRPLYTKYGFSVDFDSKKTNGAVTYYGTASHSQGFSKTKQVELPADNSGSKNAIQAEGATILYAKRYLIGMLFNIVTKDEDDIDDAKGLSGYITAAQKELLVGIIKRKEIDVLKFLKYLKVNSLDDLPAKDFLKAKTALEGK